MLLVLNKDERSVLFLNEESGELLASIRVDRNPHEAALTPDGAIAYVSNAGANTVSVLDATLRREITRLSDTAWRFPHGMELTPDGRYLWLAVTRSNAVWVLERNPDDPAEHRVARVIPTGQELSHMVHFSPDASRAYVPNIGSGTLTVIDVAGMELVTQVTVGPGPEGVAVHPLDGSIYVANQEDGSLFVLDPETFELRHRLQLGDTPVRVAFTHDGVYALVSNRRSHELSVIAHKWEGATETPQPWEIKRFPVGRWPGQIVMGPDGQHAWVTNNKTNDISMIELATFSEIDRFPAGIHPDGMIWV